MRRRFGWLLTLLAAVPAWGSDLPQFPFIHVTGHATREVSPDLARVSFAVKARDASAEVAARVVSDRTQQVLDLLAARGIAAADIDAHAIAKEVIFERDSGVSGGTRRGPPRYEVSRSLAIVVRSVASWPDIGTRLLEMPNIEDLEASFDRSDREAILAELLATAARDAQQRAQRVAAGFGQRLGAVQAVSQDQFDEIGSRFLRANLRYGGNSYAGAPAEVMVTGSRVTAAQVLVPATIELGQSVNALYRLESAPR